MLWWNRITILNNPLSIIKNFRTLYYFNGISRTFFQNFDEISWNFITLSQILLSFDKA